MTIGAATDPYQPVEGRYRLTRACIVELSRALTPFAIITRGPMVWRDVDVLQEASLRAEVSVNVSVPTLDDRVWRTTEPGTAPPRRRLEIVRRLVDAGIRTNVAIAPILPGLSDRPGAARRAVAAAREAGAHHIWANVLNLRPGTREHFLDVPRARLAGGARPLRAALRRPELPPARARSRPSRGTSPSLAREHAATGRPPLRPRPVPTQLTLV